jgi:hypothetical protein
LRQGLGESGVVERSQYCGDSRDAWVQRG